MAPDTIGVCVKPLHFSYNKSLELLQFIELNRILGVSRYVAPSHYNNSLDIQLVLVISILSVLGYI